MNAVEAMPISSAHANRKRARARDPAPDAATPGEPHGFRLGPEALAVKIDGQHRRGELALGQRGDRMGQGLPALDAKRNEIAQRI
jgi:hypothetical protein